MLGLGAWIFAAHMSDAARLTCRGQNMSAASSSFISIYTYIYIYEYMYIRIYLEYVHLP